MVLVHTDHAEAAGILERRFDGADDGIRLLFDQKVVHVGVVHLIDAVAGEDQQIFGFVLVEEKQILDRRHRRCRDTNLR
ncbi:MAG: hypothetical protein U0361_23205 [Nitrospiraceae bacterium]